MNIVIIGKNEGASVDNMLASLIDLNCKRIWIADRCTDGTVKKLKSLKEFYVKTSPFLIGRQTSYCRNLGLSFCDKGENVLFLDGDRYIKHGSIKNLESCKSDIVLLLLENDNREYMDFQSAYGDIHNGFYSCGVYFKNSAITKILDFQKGELFSSKMQKHWGIEDTYLGDVCYHLGLTCEIFTECRLSGSFDSKTVGMENIEKRLIARQKLNIKW